MTVRIVINQSEIRSLFGPRLGIARDLVRRGRNVETAAKRLCPVDTGRLRSSIESHVEQDARGLVAIIGSDVEYSGYVERGTSRMRGRHYLERALVAARL